MSSPTAHDRLANYLRATGWDAPLQLGPSGGLWRHPPTGLGLPVPSELAEGGLDWQQILLRLAGVEGTTTAAIGDRLTGRLVVLPIFGLPTTSSSRTQSRTSQASPWFATPGRCFGLARRPRWAPRRISAGTARRRTKSPRKRAWAIRNGVLS